MGEAYVQPVDFQADIWYDDDDEVSTLYKKESRCKFN